MMCHLGRQSVPLQFSTPRLSHAPVKSSVCELGGRCRCVNLNIFIQGTSKDVNTLISKQRRGLSSAWCRFDKGFNICGEFPAWIEAISRLVTFGSHSCSVRLLSLLAHLPLQSMCICLCLSLFTHRHEHSLH